MSCTKLVKPRSGWANFGGEGGPKPNYRKIHNMIWCRRWIGWDVLHWTRMSKTDQAVLLVDPSLPPNREFYFGFRPGSFRKWYSLNQPTFFAKKWSPMSSIVSNFRSSNEQGWRNGQMTSGSVLHSCPLQQNWIQALSRKSRGKILFIFIFDLLSQNVPIFNWARFTVLLATTWHCFFWHYTGDSFDLLLGVVVLHLPPQKCKLPCCHWRSQVWDQNCWVDGVHQDKRYCKS